MIVIFVRPVLRLTAMAMQEITLISIIARQKNWVNRQNDAASGRDSVAGSGSSEGMESGIKFECPVIE